MKVTERQFNNDMLELSKRHSEPVLRGEKRSDYLIRLALSLNINEPWLKSYMCDEYNLLEDYVEESLYGTTDPVFFPEPVYVEQCNKQIQFQCDAETILVIDHEYADVADWRLIADWRFIHEYKGDVTDSFRDIFNPSLEYLLELLADNLL